MPPHEGSRSSLRRLPVLALAALSAVFASGRTAAQPAPQRPPEPASPTDSIVVARVGSRVITAGDLSRRLAGTPPFQLRPLGSTPEEIRKNFLEKVLVREALLAEGAVAERLADRPEVQDRIIRQLRAALLAWVRQDVATSSPITEAEVKAYYEANRSKFHAPPRITIWRILVGSEAEARAILDEMKKEASAKSDGLVKRWNELAREKSLDKATAMRGGNLGPVAPDGSTAEPAVKVDPALFSAASNVKDAELVPDPVKEGDRWAVVWRRQSMRAVERTLENEAPSIRQVLAHERIDKRVKDLLAARRAESLAEFHPELVDIIDVTGTGDLQPMRRPGSLPPNRRASAAPPAPVPGPGGLR